MSVASEINRIKSNIADAYTEAESKGATMPATENSANLADTVASIPQGSTPTLQSKTVTPTTAQQSVTPDSGYDGLSNVTVNATPLETATVTPTAHQQVVTPTAPNIGLSSVTVEGATNYMAKAIDGSLESYTVTDDASTVRTTAFGWMPFLKEVVFNMSYEIPSTSSEIFRYCSSLIKCTFNNPQTRIPKDMFWNCTALEEQILPSSITTIDLFAFEGASNFKRLILKSNTVCVLININAFVNTPFRNGVGGTVYVPQSLLSSYQSATNWSALESTTFSPIEGSIYE